MEKAVATIAALMELLAVVARLDVTGQIAAFNVRAGQRGVIAVWTDARP